MDHNKISFSIRGAWSHSWNVNSSNHNSSIVRIAKSMVASFSAVFKRYRINILKIDSIKNQFSKSFFVWEYEKKIHGRGVASGSRYDNAQIKETITISGVDMNALIKSRRFSHDIHYIVKGFIHLENLPIKSLPDNMTISGSLYIKNLYNLTHLSKKLIVHGKILLNHCESLTYLPKELTSVSKSLFICRCPISHLPKKFTVNGDLSLWQCCDLKNLSKYLTVHGDLTISYCLNFKKMPSKCIVDGDIIINP